jgi:hypothetical protein
MFVVKVPPMKRTISKRKTTTPKARARPFETSEWCTTEEARIYLGGSVTREFLSRAVGRGLIPAYRLGFETHATRNVDRRPLRFLKKDLDEFLLKRRVVVALVEPPSPKARRADVASSSELIEATA